MHPIQAQIEKLLVDAAECEMLSSLATDPVKRLKFSQVAEDYRRMAHRISAEINHRKLRQEAA
jgi:hypothetical protein